MTIQILGGGCAKCEKLEQSTRAALENMGIEAEIVKVRDMDEIMDMGVMVTPALAVDGDVKTTGKVLKPSEIEEILKTL